MFGPAQPSVEPKKGECPQSLLREVFLLSKSSSPNARWIGLFVLLLIVCLGELTALVLEDQNNVYLRQYVSDNRATTFAAATGLLILAIGAGYLASRKHGARAGPRVLTFATIASFVGRRHRIIVIFWVLLLVVSFPLFQQLSQVITSTTTGGQSTTSQSAQAQALMAQEFPHPQANTSTIILLQGNDVTNHATKRSTIHLEQHFLAPGVINGVENVTTVYSLERTLLLVYFLQTGDSYFIAQLHANQTLWAFTLSTYPLQIPSEILRNFISPSKDAMIILVDFFKSPGSFGSADTDPILKNVITIRDIISQLKASDGGT